MLQPFILFEGKFSARLLELKKYYLVAQSYGRAPEDFEEHKIPILVTDYDQMGQAKMHLNAVRNDKYACIIRLDQEKHNDKLLEMLSGGKYRIYWSVLRSADDLKKRLHASYKDKIRHFVERKTTWRISGDDKVDTRLESTFGELFLILKWRSQKLRVKFEDIEKS
jgi:hypothetical protein